MTQANPYQSSDDEPIVQVVQQGEVCGLELGMGSEAETYSFSVAQTRDMGSEAASTEMIAQPILSHGSEDTSMTVTVTGSGTHNTGSEDGYMNILGTFSQATGSEDGYMGQVDGTFSSSTGSEDGYMNISGVFSEATGSEDASMGILGTFSQATGTDAQGTFTANAVATISDFVDTAVNNQDAGAVAWQNVANAQGSFDDTEASWTVNSGVTPVNEAATLRCSGLLGAGTISGFTLTGAKMYVRYRYDLTITLPLVDTATLTITLRDSAGALISTLRTRTEDDGQTTQATLVTEEYDIFALVTEAQLDAGLQIWVAGTASLTLVTSGDVSMQVDGVRLDTIYTRTGIT